MASVNPQICVTALSNEAFTWIELYDGIDEDELQELIQEFLDANDSEKWEITDTDDMAGYDSSDLETICKVANLIHEQESVEAVKGFIDCCGESELDNFDEYYYGCWESETAFVENMASDIYEIPQHLEFYIDYEKMAHDWFMTDYYSHEASYAEVHVYRR